MLDRKTNKTIETTNPFLLPFFKFPFFRFSCIYLFVFFILSNKLNSISCGICLSFKRRHLELFWKIIIQLSSTGIFLGLWSRCPPFNFTEQVFFLPQLWMAASNHLINKCDQKIRQMKNQIIIERQIGKKN